jgi:hypothetical protein
LITGSADFSAHEVFTASYKGGEALKNGKLLDAAEEEGFDVLVTGDKSLSYEQNLTIGNDQFLEAKYDASGARTDATGQKSADSYDYFWFDKTGANLVDFRPILLAAKFVSPTAPGSNCIWHFCEPLRSRIGVSDGTAIVDFKFSRGQVVVTKVRYQPEGVAEK